MNGRGSIPMNFDESGCVTHARYEKLLVQLHIESVELNCTCTNPSAAEFANGNYIALKMRVEINPEHSNTKVPELEFTNADFTVMSPQGPAD